MAHEIETMALRVGRAWHGLGAKVSDTDLYDWPSPAERPGSTGRSNWCRSSRRQAASGRSPGGPASTDGKVLGTVVPDSKPGRTQQRFEWFQPFLDAKEAALHTAGSCAAEPGVGSRQAEP